MPILTNQSPASELAEYEDFVANSPHGHMMQSVNWSQVKSNWRADFVYLRGADGSIKAALSILSIANDGQHSFLYAPRGPVCDLANVELVSALTKEAQPVIEKHNGFLLRMDPESDLQPGFGPDVYPSRIHRAVTRDRGSARIFQSTHQYGG